MERLPTNFSKQLNIAYFLDTKVKMNFQGNSKVLKMLKPALPAGKRVQHVGKLFLLIAFNLNAQVFSDKDVEICNSKFELAVEKNLSEKPIGDVIVEIGKSFLGTDYLAAGLEKEGEEKLVINLTGFDCTTFIENALVFARCIKQDKTSFEDYQDELTKIRYRNGVIDQYPSRLHYFSDWIYDNTQKGIVEDVTKEIGGEATRFNINFMSTHPESYKQLKDNPDFIPVIKKQEEAISKREYYYVPKESVDKAENKINNGDLIAFTTNIPGLDISHTGIAIKEQDGRIHLLHSPNVGKKVQITNEPLSEYIQKVKKHTGIIVLRALGVKD